MGHQKSKPQRVHVSLKKHSINLMIQIKINLKRMLFTCGLICLYFPARGYEDRQTITLSAYNAPLEIVFGAIHQQTGYKIIYTPGMMPHPKTVTIQVLNADINEVMMLCMANQGLGYTIVDKVIFISPIAQEPRKRTKISRKHKVRSVNN